jgi:hypothetical protein
MGFRAIEINAMLLEAQLERERHARHSAANLSSDTAHRTPSRDRLRAASPGFSATGRATAAQPAPTPPPRARPDRSHDGG